MDRWDAYLVDIVSTFVREALAPAHPDARTVQLVSAFLDLPTYKALRARGVASRTAAATVARMAAPLARTRSPEEER